MIQKPNIPKGTRDFGHAQMNKRNYIFSTIRSVFSLYGYNQIETPAMELMSSLMGKYGEEGDKLLFRIQNSGEKADKAPEKGLRYDLTVPFARYVVQHKDELQFPFRRYQIQPVWRADRPQKGRYREFYQCDADIIGTNSLLCEVELIQMMEEVYKCFGIRVSLHLNNRKILYGIAEVIGAPDKMTDITTAIDKIDKIGIENVNKELSERGLSEESISLLQPILHLQGSNEDKLNQIAEVLCQSKTGLEGIRETRSILDMYNQSGKGPQDDKQMFSIELDLTLARGLNYYTGAIFEVKALDASIGSITGGGRYDNLTGIFGLPNVSGVGISFGADRIYDVLDELNLYPEETSESVQLMFISMGEAELIYSSQWAQSLRKQGIKTEIYPEAAKIKKMLGYANNRGINRVAIVGGNEMEQNKVLYKDMQSGEQRTVDIEELVKLLK